MVNNNILVDIPKTYTVAYFDEAEWNKDLSPQEIIQQQEIADFYNQLGVGEKGYGPCYRNCNRANADCECYLPEKCVALHLVCPAPKNAPPYCTDKIPGPFYHGAGCGGRTYIDTSLYIRCMKPGCGTVIHVRNTLFTCSTHQTSPSKASKEALGNALTVLNSAWKGKSYAISKCIERMIDKLMDEDGLL
jgi:hypothetical protein